MTLEPTFTGKSHCTFMAITVTNLTQATSYGPFGWVLRLSFARPHVEGKRSAWQNRFVHGLFHVIPGLSNLHPFLSVDCLSGKTAHVIY